MAPVVTVLQHRLLHYRVGLFEALRARLATQGVELRLVHGQASPTERERKDEGSLRWADVVRNRFWSVGGTDVCWQSLPSYVSRSDLVIVMQENRLLSNYPLLLRGRWGRPLTAFWGHGRNFQSDRPSGLRERWKAAWIRQVDWWFAYTSATVEILRASGFPADRITCLDNAIDTTAFQRDLAAADGSIGAWRERLGLGGASTVALFCGSLYPEKRLDLLIEAADRLRAMLEDFRLVIVGDGPSATSLRDAVATRPWARMVGVQRGIDKAALYRLADVIVNPGVIGLHVLDAFCAGRPLVTMQTRGHGPEIAYVEHGANGYIARDREDLVEVLASLVTDRALHDRICGAAVASGRFYTLDRMVDNFAAGISRCLQVPA